MCGVSLLYEGTHTKDSEEWKAINEIVTIMEMEILQFLVVLIRVTTSPFMAQAASSAMSRVGMMLTTTGSSLILFSSAPPGTLHQKPCPTIKRALCNS
jgi:hypothetical protein